MIYKVEKINQPEPYDVFRFTYTKTIKGINGNEVTVIDREEETTMENLENQEKELERQLAEVNAKIAKINELEV